MHDVIINYNGPFFHLQRLRMYWKRMMFRYYDTAIAAFDSNKQKKSCSSLDVASSDKSQKAHRLVGTLLLCKGEQWCSPFCL